MYRLKVPIPGPLRIVINEKGIYKLNEQRQRFPYLPDPDRLILDLRKLSSQGGVPARLYQQRDKAQPELQLYTDRHYYLVLYLAAQRQDGYVLGHVEPLGLREQERMNKGVLLLQATSWERCGALRELQGYRGYWEIIIPAWQSLETWRRQARAAAGQDVQEAITADQENYLKKIQTLIDLEHRLALDQYQFSPQIQYYKVEATGEKRYARDIYTFLVHGSPTIDEKNMLRSVEERDFQARVLSYKGQRLTLKFERAVDLDRIPPSGSFEPIVSGAIYRTQQEALATLREGEAKNPHLLRVLVEQQFQHYTPAAIEPEKQLNFAQRVAFQRALTLPDLLLVWGPPGTGKSRTITEIARQYSKQGKRVLITSGTHKAVDTVLEQFLTDEHLVVVRFGHEDRILEAVRARLTIDEQTRLLQQQILKRTGARAQQLQHFLREKSALASLLAQAQACLAQWHTNQQHARDLQQLLAYAGRQIEAHYRPRLQETATNLQELEARLEKSTQKMYAWHQKQQELEPKSEQGVLGFWYRWRVNLLRQRLQRLYLQVDETRRVVTSAQQAHQAVQREYQDTLNRDPTYRQHATNLTNLQTRSTRLLEEVHRYVRELSQQTQGLFPPFTGALSGGELQRYLSQVPASMAVLEKRALLLRSWLGELETNAEQLTPEVLRYADIVGATCIGVATAKGLTDIDFDLVIVDEAGQISTPNLLVPLVRARRAILVGDHMQLPPFVDSTVKAWLANLTPQAQQDLGLDDEEFDGSQLLPLLTRSAFEQLLLARPPQENLVAFTEQRRMPALIAGFASQQFYNRQLTTVHNNKSFARDPFFRSELAFVDTSTLPIEERKERKRAKTEEWDNPGFTNQCEARLVARLAARYERQKAEWAIIVPYRAQARSIILSLEKLIEAPDFRWEDRVATVDSFQGGERDYILYSFTRSNPYGGVGFLTELRRFNVALTRAKQQIVLVGDLATLAQADDAPFRMLMQGLRNYVQEYGELVSYQECQRRLG